MTDDRFKEITEILKSSKSSEIKKIKKEELLEYTNMLLETLKNEEEKPETVSEEAGSEDSVDLISSLRNQLESSIKNGNLLDGKLRTTEATVEERTLEFKKLQEKFDKLQSNRNKYAWTLVFAVVIIILLLIV